MDEKEQAVTELEALSKVDGALKVITNEVDPKGSKEYPNTDPRHFVLHDVVEIEGPNHRGQFTAHTAEGDWCQGQPDALLVRLREWRR